MAINIGEPPRPMVPKLTQAGAPLTSHDGSFVRATQSLWWRCSGTRRSWVWPDPDTAPYISTATLSTYTDLLIGDSTANATLNLPWAYQLGAVGMHLWVTLCLVDANERASIQASLTGLDSAITGKTCPAAVINASSRPPPGLWSRLTNSWRVGTVGLEFTGMTSSAMDASRRGRSEERRVGKEGRS